MWNSSPNRNDENWKKKPKRLTVWKRLSKLNGRSWYRVKSVKSLEHFPRPLDFDKTEPARVQFRLIIWSKSVRNQSPTWRTYTDILGRGSFRSTSPKTISVLYLYFVTWGVNIFPVFWNFPLNARFRESKLATRIGKGPPILVTVWNVFSFCK
jgi:hypothetical protein